MVNSNDETVRETDYDALSSRVSAYVMGYLPMDAHIMELTNLVLKYHLMSIGDDDYSKFALNRRLKRQFFGLFLEDKKKERHPLVRGHSTTMGVFPCRGNHHHPIHQLPQSPSRTMYKPPLINRGTYLRTKVITDKLEEFIKKYPDDSNVQVLSLGSGNDSRVFQILPNHSNVQYFELDFESTTRIKRLAILSSHELSTCVGAIELKELPSSQNDVLNQESFLNTSNYHLLPMDLRLMVDSPELVTKSLEENNFNFNLPTLIISECCICYLSQDYADSILQYLFNNIKDIHFVMYEPIGKPDTNYGDVMIKNLGNRGIEMPTLMIYGTTQSQIDRFMKLSPEAKIWCKDMKWVSENLINDEEFERINKLEMLDEMEEFNLMNSHYCLLLVN